MEIIIHTKSRRQEPLLTAINKKIKNGELKTWELKEHGKQEDVLYNHTPDQWSGRVLLKPTDHEKGLEVFTTRWSTSPEPDEAAKGYIIGRFVEVLMVHFRTNFDLLEVRP